MGRRFDESKIKRDRRGRFADKLGAAAVALQKSRDPRPGDPPIKTSSVEEAVALLAKGHKVELSRPREVSTLLKKLAEIAQEAKRLGTKAPNYDLCRVTVKGTSLFCVHTKGVPRLKMPQLRGIPTPGSPADALPRDRGKVDIAPLFRERLVADGVKVRSRRRKASHLKASQNELNGVNVAGIMGRLERGDSKIDDVLMVSRDDYVVDGHHRWAAVVGLDAANDRLDELEMNVDEIGLPILELLDRANAFAEEMGIPGLGFAGAVA